MDAIINFLKGIGAGIVAAFDFIISFFQDVIYIIQLTGRFLAQIPSYFAWLPPQLLGLLVVLFSIVVIYKIMGREG